MSASGAPILPPSDRARRTSEPRGTTAAGSEDRTRHDTEDVMRVIITVGPSEQVANAIDYGIVAEDPDTGMDMIEGSGWSCPESRYPTSPRAWVRRLRQHVTLPMMAREAGRRWADATVTPYGWSQGAGHAPQGIRIVWDLP